MDIYMYATDTSVHRHPLSPYVHSSPPEDMLDHYYCVGDFDLHDDDLPVRHGIPDLLEDELPELMSQEGSVAHPAHGGRVRKRSPPEQPAADAGEIGSAAVEAAARHLLVEEDGMTASLDWDDGGDLYRELSAACAGCHIPADGRHALAVEKQGVGVSGESKVVESSETPADGQAVVMGSGRGPAKAHAGDGRKRKASQGYDSECRSEDVEFESGNKREDTGRSAASIRRSRTAKVHKIAEQRRRDRINEKMKVLQELIPRCNKSDKASMLDEAIEYLKSLKLQVQMMSLGCNAGPVKMFPGVQTYLPHLGIGMGIGMGIGCGSFFPCLPLAGPAPFQFGPRPLVPSFHSPNMGMAVADQTRMEAPNWQQNPTSNSVGMHSTNMVQIPRIGDPYCHVIGIHQLNGSSQGCVMDESGTGKGTNAAESNKLG